MYTIVRREIGHISLKDELLQMITLISHESSNVRAEFLTQLRITLNRNRHELHAGNFEGEMGEVIKKVLGALLLRCSDWAEVPHFCWNGSFSLTAWRVFIFII
jgi:hypothetical protein